MIGLALVVLSCGGKDEGCEALCGNGEVECDESCDDGNLEDGDGCSAQCTLEFLRDEINGVGTTLTSPTPAGAAVAYKALRDPFFDGLRAWGDTMWQLWDHNKTVSGAAPVLMTDALWVP